MLLNTRYFISFNVFYIYLWHRHITLFYVIPFILLFFCLFSNIFIFQFSFLMKILFSIDIRIGYFVFSFWRIYSHLFDISHPIQNGIYVALYFRIDICGNKCFSASIALYHLLLDFASHPNQVFVITFPVIFFLAWFCNIFLMRMRQIHFVQKFLTCLFCLSFIYSNLIKFGEIILKFFFAIILKFFILF